MPVSARATSATAAYIRGLGLVSCYGVGVACAVDGMRAGRTGITPLTLFSLPFQDRMQVNQFDHAPFPAGSACAAASMEAVAHEALAEARLDRAALRDAALIVGAGSFLFAGEADYRRELADTGRRIIEVNPAYERVTGRSRDEVLGTALQVPGDDDAGAAPWQLVASDGHWTGEIVDRRKNGELFPSWATLSAVRNDAGELTHYVSVTRDITVLKQNERQLKQLAFYDSLTGLPNRALFNDRLGVALARSHRDGGVVAVMCIDLDHFKYVNDTLGHPAGDRLLIEIAQRIGRCVREVDTVARMGGDEFMVMLTDVRGEGEAVAVAERIVEAVGRPVELDGETVYVGASVGVSLCPRDGADAGTLHKTADLAMYEAKHGGRGQVRVFTADMLARGCERLALSVEIDAALSNGELQLHYQPIVDAVSGEAVAAEALIRWRKPSGEWVPPEKFIPHAEEAGLIRRIDAWVLERACSDAAQWRARGRPLRVSVNLSAVSIQQDDIPQLIADVLRRSGLPPELLTIEITETAVVTAPKTALAVLERITALGVRLSMDDFGTGYSSLNSLSRFPIDCIKLDRLFTSRIGRDAASEEIIRSLLELARKLELRVVAEGVECDSQRAFLESFGCELVQGFCIGRPMPAAQLSAWRPKPRGRVAAAS